MIELSRRTRIMPHGLLRRGTDTYPCERVIFRDTATGATIWKMTRAPHETRHVYSNISPWNANGSHIALRTIRNGEYLTMLLPADGSELKSLLRPYAYHWCPVRPERLYFRNREPRGKWRMRWINVFTGKQHPFGPVTPLSAVVGPSHDGRKVLLVENAQSRTARSSVGRLVDVDTGKWNSMDFKYVTHQVWFTKRPDYAISLNYEVRNKYRQGMTSDSWLIDADGRNLRKVRDHHMSHRGFSPDGKRVVFHGTGIRVRNVEGGGEKRVARISGGGHTSWQVTPEWFVASMGNAIRCLGANDQGFQYRLCCPNTGLGFSEYSSSIFPDSSRDGTKIGFTSNMLGDTDFYQVIARLPAPPQRLQARVRGGKV